MLSNPRATICATLQKKWCISELALVFSYFWASENDEIEENEDEGVKNFSQLR